MTGSPQRVTPIIGDVPDTKKKQRKISRKEARDFLRERGLLGKRGIKWARKRIRKIEFRQSLPRGREITVNETEHAWPIIYGTVRYGGVLTFLHNKHESSDNTMNLRHIITLAGHEISSVEKIFLDNNEVQFASAYGNPPDGWATGGRKPDGTEINYTNLVYCRAGNKGTASQTAYTDPMTDLPSYWTSNHRQRGLAHVFLHLKWNAVKFPDGEPDIMFEVKGKPVYDPRTATTAYSDNPALCLSDYLTDSTYGPGYDSSQIYIGTSTSDVGSLQWAAAKCDELVNLNGGGTEKRYRAHGVFFSDEDHEDIIAEFEQAMGGFVTYVNAKWRFWPGVYESPSVSLDIDDVMSEVEITTLKGRGERFNGVRATYVDANDAFKVKEMPTMAISAYQTEDGEEIYDDVGFALVTSASQAQRLAKIRIEQSRLNITVKADFSLKALQLEPGDTVSLTIDRYGWSSKTFLVEEMGLELTQQMALVVPMELRETASSVYDWDETQDEQAVNQPSTTELPDPFSVTDPTNLALASGTDHLLINGDGSVITRVQATWDVPGDGFVNEGGVFELQIKESGGSWRNSAFVDGTHSEFYFVGINDGASIDVRIRAISALGTYGDWLTEAGHTVVGKTEAPSDVTGFSGLLENEGITFTWTAISDLDLSYYEIRKGSSWATGDPIGTPTSTTFFHAITLQSATTFWIKAVDTTGNYSDNAVSVTLTPTGNGQVQNFTATVIDNHVLLDWDPPSTGTYDVAYYNVYKGPSASSSYLLGRAYGTFKNYFTQLGESATFWVAAVDIAGSEGTAVSKAVDIYPPPDYILRASDSLAISEGTLSNAIEDGSLDSAFLAPVQTGRTWAQHFTDAGNTTFQDFIDDGYTVYAEPAYTSSDGTYTVEIDLGVVVAGSRINLSYTVEQLGTGTATITPQIRYKENSGDSWTDGTAGANEIFATQFRYIQFEIKGAASTDKDLARISNIQYRVDVKKQTDSGSGTSSASVATTVSFNLDFLDIESIQVTANDSSAGYTSVVDFTDSPNPTDFDVYIYDLDGNQVAKDFYWTAEGAINPS
jgi:hypothetical protein